MKIGLITGEYPPKQGGVGDFTRELAKAMIACGNEVHVITDASSQMPDASNVVVHRSIKLWGIGCWKQIGKIVNENNLDVVNIQYEPAAYGGQGGINLLPSGWARRSIKVPMVTTFHDLLVPYLFPKAGSLRRKAVDYLAHKSDAVIVTNEEDRHRLLPLAPCAIPIGSNIDPQNLKEFDLQNSRADWKVRSNEMLIGYFGFLNLSKGGEVLMRALKALIDRGLAVKLMLIGGRTGSSDPANVEYAKQVDQLIESLNLKEHVIETGYLESIDVSRALMTCDVMALPYQDGASLRRGSLLASIAHGRSIVTTTPRFAIEGLVDNQSALFVSPDDPIALAGSIERVLNDRVLREQLERGAREASKLYTWDRIARQTIDVYERVMSNE